MGLMDRFRAWRRTDPPATSTALQQMTTTLIEPQAAVLVHPSDPQSGAFSHSSYNTLANMRVTPDTSTQVAAIWGCMDVIASAASATDWNVYGGVRGEANKIALPRDALQYILNTRWNPEMTAQAGKRAVMLAAAGWGTGYAEIERDMAGRIKALWPIAPHRVEMKRDLSTGRLYAEVTQEYYGGTVDVALEDLFIVRGASMVGFVGDNTLSRAIRTVATALAIDQYAESYFGNNAQLGTVFVMKTGIKDDPNYNRAKESLEKRHAGVKNAYTTGLFTGDWDIKTFGQNMDQSLYAEVKATSVEDICFVPGTKIITPGGLKNIEDMGVGDSVLTHKGRWRRVSNVMSRPYDGKVVTAKAKGLEPVTATDNHPFYVQKVKPNRSHRQEPVGGPEWVPAGLLDAGSVTADGTRGRKEFHALTVPRLNHDVGILRLDMREWASDDAVVDETTVRFSSNNRATPVTRFVEAGFDLGWLCGLYASDGSVGGHQVAFYLGAHETAATEKLRGVLKSLFGVDSTTARKGNVDRTDISNRVMREFFADFGPTAPTKRLPSFVSACGPAFRAGVVAGMVDGDGCVYGDRILVRSTSENLIWQLRLLLWADGVHGALATTAAGTWGIEGRSGVSLPIHTVEWRPDAKVRGSLGLTDDYSYFNLSSVEEDQYSGVVYNLEVQEDESYTTVGGCVHNCRWFHVPPHKIAHLSKATNNNIEHQGLEFSRDTMRPWVREIEQEADYKLIPYRGPERFVELDVDWTEQGDYKSRMEAYSLGRNMGVFTGNDVARKLGENTFGADGDIRIVQGANVRLEDVGAAYADTAPPAADTAAQAWLTSVYARVQRRAQRGGKDCSVFAAEILADLDGVLGDRAALALLQAAEVVKGRDPAEAAAAVFTSTEQSYGSPTA